MENPHFASSALSMKNCSQIAVPTPQSEEEEEKYWRKGRTKNSGLDDSSPLVLSALARAVPMWGCR